MKIMGCHCAKLQVVHLDIWVEEVGSSESMPRCTCDWQLCEKACAKMPGVGGCFILFPNDHILPRDFILQES